MIFCDELHSYNEYLLALIIVCDEFFITLHSQTNLTYEKNNTNNFYSFCRTYD